MNKLDNIFGERVTPVEKQNKQSLQNKMMPLDIDPERLKMIKDPAWREAERKRLLAEDEADFGVSEVDKYADERVVNMGPLFNTNDPVYMNQKRAHAITHNKIDDTIPPTDLEYMRIYEDGLNTSKRLRGQVTNRMMRGFSQSVKAFQNEEWLDNYKKMQFIKWLQMEKLDHNKVFANEQLLKTAWAKFLSATRLGLDYILNEMTKIAHSIFVHNIVERDTTIPEEDMIQILTSFKVRENMMIDFVKDNGKFMDISNFNIMGWYFGKYGYSADDRKFFEDGYVDSRGNLFKNELDKFALITGFDFLDIFKYYLDEYRKESEYGNWSEDEINETEEITDMDRLKKVSSIASVNYDEDDITYEEV